MSSQSSRLGRAAIRRRQGEWLQLPVFAYGTLRRGQPNYWLLRGNTVKELPGTLAGVQLVGLRSYPVMLDAQAESVVYGELMVLHPSLYNRVLPDLDALEGYNPHQPDPAGMYRRERRLVHCKNGGDIWAWAYLGNPAALANVAHEVIPNGDWVQWKRERISKMLG